MSSAKVQGTINGQTVTLAEVDLSDSAIIANFISGHIALPLTRPVKLDAGTAINLVTVQGHTSSIATATVHTITQSY